MDQEQAIGTRRIATLLAIPADQHFAHPVCGLSGEAHLQQCTRDVANHMQQKGVGLDFNNDKTVVPVNRD